LATAQQTPDPILSVSKQSVSAELFQNMISTAVLDSPAFIEAKFGLAGALAVRREAQSGQFPVIDLGVSGYRSLARNFSNDPDSIIERSRGNGRIDATANVQQVIWDFGATRRRIDAATARADAANFGLDQAAEGVALRAIGAWYDVFAFEQLVALSQAYIEDQRGLKDALNFRISQGVSASADMARVDSAIANSAARHAQYGRRLGDAVARYREVFKIAPPAAIARAPAASTVHLSREMVMDGAARSAAVRSANAQAQALRSEARAARADTRPSISGGVDAGRYGIFEGARNDYDVRARLTLRYRLLGPGAARADQAEARAGAGAARAMAMRDEAVREAEQAWSEREGLQAALTAQEADYRAARLTRDAVIERFRYSRGTLFDVLDTQDRFFATAASYLQTLSELDAAHYVVLARTGALLPELGLHVGAFKPWE
jgi:outer membrane protein, adhesin transport system